MHAVDTTQKTFAGCVCGQLFSGPTKEGAKVRLAEHIANPDPDSLGALLIAYVSN